MKYKDIPQFTEAGDYEVTMPLWSIENALKEFEKDYKLEMNPDFQRGNVWSKEKQIAYIEFLLRGGRSARVIYFNCPYFKDYSTDKYDMNMVCLDGLQRLTAILGFVRNEIPAFGTLCKDFEDTKVMLRGVDIRFNVNDLKTKKEVLQWYVDFNAGGTVHSQEEIDRVRKMIEELDGE